MNDSSDHRIDVKFSPATLKAISKFWVKNHDHGLGCTHVPEGVRFVRRYQRCCSLRSSKGGGTDVSYCANINSHFSRECNTFTASIYKVISTRYMVDCFSDLGRKETRSLFEKHRYVTYTTPTFFFFNWFIILVVFSSEAHDTMIPGIHYSNKQDRLSS